MESETKREGRDKYREVWGENEKKLYVFFFVGAYKIRPFVIDEIFLF